MAKSYFESLVDEYIEKNSSDSTYINHINKFKDYIMSVGKENSILDITYHDLDKSIGYHNKLGSIKTINSMKNHLEAVKAFFVFLHKERVQQNVFKDIPDYGEFRDNLTIKYNLKEEVNRTALPMDIVIKLLDAFENDNKFKSDINGISTSQMILKIYVKITLIAPAKRNVICNIKFKDFINDFRQVYINSVLIKIPNSLRKDILDAIEWAQINRGKIYSNDDLFFDYICTHKPFSGSSLTLALFFALKHIGFEEIDQIIKSKKSGKSSYPLESIMNTAIISLIENNTNPFLVAKINGITLKSLQEKLELLGVYVNNQDDLINNAMAKSEYYQYI